MPSNKDRLYVALYARGGAPTMPEIEDAYHWALLVGPKIEKSNSKGTCFHVKDEIQIGGTPTTSKSIWKYDEREITLLPTSSVLIRVMIGKVKDRDKLASIFRNIPVRSMVAGWNCVAWVKEAIETALRDHRVLKPPKNVDWINVRNTAMWYVEQKKASHRFDGQGDYDRDKVATWDMIEDNERVS